MCRDRWHERHANDITLSAIAGGAKIGTHLIQWVVLVFSLHERIVYLNA